MHSKEEGKKCRFQLSADSSRFHAPKKACATEACTVEKTANRISAVRNDRGTGLCATSASARTKRQKDHDHGGAVTATSASAGTMRRKGQRAGRHTMTERLYRTVLGLQTERGHNRLTILARPRLVRDLKGVSGRRTARRGMRHCVLQELNHTITIWGAVIIQIGRKAIDPPCLSTRGV